MSKFYLKFHFLKRLLIQVKSRQLLSSWVIFWKALKWLIREWNELGFRCLWDSVYGNFRMLLLLMYFYAQKCLNRRDIKPKQAVLVMTQLKLGPKLWRNVIMLNAFTPSTRKREKHVVMQKLIFSQMKMLCLSMNLHSMLSAKKSLLQKVDVRRMDSFNQGYKHSKNHKAAKQAASLSKGIILWHRSWVQFCKRDLEMVPKTSPGINKISGSFENWYQCGHDHAHR